MVADTGPSGVRLAALRRHLAAEGLDGAVVPRFDAHQGEYVAPRDERLAWLSGFTGSAGLALVLADRALIFVDGRYQVQVRGEADPALWTVEHYDDAPVHRWLARTGPAGLRIGCNPMLVPLGMFERLAEALEARGGALVPLDRDPVDAVWPDQPGPPLGRIEPVAVEVAGEAAGAKRARMARALAEAGADLLVETQPDAIAWLLNVRGSDVALNPVPHSMLLLGADGAAEWFVDDRKLPNDRDALDLDGVTLGAPGDLLPALARRGAGARVRLDPEATSAAVALAVGRAGGTVLRGPSPVALAKAVKNEVEREGFRAAHREDAVAWVETLAWIARAVPARAAAGRPVTEREVEAAILRRREAAEGFLSPSFRTISAAGAHAALCHYAASEASDAPLRPEGLYLLDSGGQYRTATTDATRTLALGPVPEAARRAYTAVLRGFIALMTLRFPAGTFGHQIDAVARRPLWDLGLDYDHGTGHGVGHRLSVHENPHRFEKIANPFPLTAGLVMTVEPGFYRVGAYGMRIENQVEVVEAGPGFLGLESLTLVPIDLAPADLAALAEGERAFLDAYHATVRAALAPRVSEAARPWLLAATEPCAVSRPLPGAS